jgi:hypothetical protein
MPGTRPWWIGANDIMSEGRYVWAENNSTGNMNWGTKQGPNGWSPFAPAPSYNTTYNLNTLDCVAAGFREDPIKWGDYDCSTKMPFVCAPRGGQTARTNIGQCPACCWPCAAGLALLGRTIRTPGRLCASSPCHTCAPCTCTAPIRHWRRGQRPDLCQGHAPADPKHKPQAGLLSDDVQGRHQCATQRL